MDVVVVPSEKELAKTGCTTYVLYLESMFGRPTFPSWLVSQRLLVMNIDNVSVCSR